MIELIEYVTDKNWKTNIENIVLNKMLVIK